MSKSHTNVIEVTAEQLPGILDKIVATNKGLRPNQQLVPYIMSAPGVGKSSVIAEFARKNDRHFTDVRLAYAAPTDVRGFPIVKGDGDNKTMDFAAPAEYPTEPGGVFLMDEFSCASRATQLAALQLLLDKKVGNYTVPDDTLLILAGNRASDRAHVEKLSSAVINRIVQITLKTDLNAWENHAVTTGADSRVIAFMRFRPNLLSDFDVSKWNGDDAFASPRSWMVVSNLLNSGTLDACDSHIRAVLLQGAVGPSAGIEFNAFLKHYESLPDIDKMLKNPSEAKIPTEPSVMWALVAALAPRATSSNIKAVLKILDKASKEFQVLCVKMVMKRDVRVMSTPDGVKWISANEKNLRV